MKIRIGDQMVTLDGFTPGTVAMLRPTSPMTTEEFKEFVEVNEPLMRLFAQHNIALVVSNKHGFEFSILHPGASGCFEAKELH
jgi:hypothetical protein